MDAYLYNIFSSILEANPRCAAASFGLRLMALCLEDE